MPTNLFNPSPTLRCDGCGVEITWSALVLRSADSRSRGGLLFHRVAVGLPSGRAGRG